MIELNGRQMRRLETIKKTLVGSCENCGGNGYREDGSMCDCMIIFQYILNLVKANIPENYWELSLKTLKVKDAYKKFVRFFINKLDNAVYRSLGVIFLGPNGVGKTSILCEIGKRAVVSGYQGQVLYLTVQQFMNAHYDKQESRENEHCSLDMINNSTILLLDELDKVYIKKESDYVLRTLEDFFRESVARGRVLVMATNWTLEDIGDNFGESFVSLINRNLRVMEFLGSDYSIQRQSQWLQLLENDVDFYADDIVNMANRLNDFKDIEAVNE